MEIIMADKKKTKNKMPSERDITEEVKKLADSLRQNFDEAGKEIEMSDTDAMRCEDAFNLLMHTSNAFVNTAIHQLYADAKEGEEILPEVILHMMISCMAVHVFARSPNRDCAYSLLTDVVSKFENLEKITEEFEKEGSLSCISKKEFQEKMGEAKSIIDHLFDTDEDSIPSDAVIH